jgi:hypothetical protein
MGFQAIRRNNKAAESCGFVVLSISVFPGSPGKTFHPLDVEQEVHHVTILHHVFLAFGAHLASFLGLASPPRVMKSL